MAQRVIRGPKLVFDIPAETKPIANLPAGKVRLVFRTNAMGKAVVRTETGVREMMLEDKGEHWIARPDLWCREKFNRVRRIAHLPGANIRAFKLFSFA